MKPLVLREIADELGLHESTISRVTTAKYMSTPFGTFELKYFFGSSLNTDAGGNASSTAVRALIKQLVAAEDPKQAAVGQPAQPDARGAGHPGGAAHGRQVPRSAEDRAGQPAQDAVHRRADTSTAASCLAPAASRTLLADEAMRVARCRAAAHAVARGGVALSQGDAARRDARSTSRAGSRSACCGRWPRRLPRRRRSVRAGAQRATGTHWITPRQTLRVDTTAQRSPLRSLNFAALRIKDAVCDVMREATGERPERRHAAARPAAGAAPRAETAPRCTSTPRASRCSSAAGARTRATRR